MLATVVPAVLLMPMLLTVACELMVMMTSSLSELLSLSVTVSRKVKATSLPVMLGAVKLAITELALVMVRPLPVPVVGACCVQA